ncbi:class I SAM-dependent methyltransferase [Pigmentibacter ruber]
MFPLKNKIFLFKIFNYSRFFVYTLEGFPIIMVQKFFGLRRKPNPPPPKDHQEKLIKTIINMIEEDINNIQKNIYSETLVLPENPIIHWKRYIEIFKDSFHSSIRKKNNEYKTFSEDLKVDEKDLPKYYKRNFHFQTDGYLSDKSAQLYSHQTEILFRGSLALTRRVLLAPVLSYIKKQNRRLKILELACGSGESTEILLSSCENIELTAIDLSSSYIKYAEKKTKNYSNIKYLNLDALNLDHFEENFDIILSSYLIHEMPEKERSLVFKSAYRKLNHLGLMVTIDSIQLGDVPDFDWALLNFPKDFHEPFYMNYIKRPILNFMENNQFTNIETNIRFLSKCVTGLKQDPNLET